MFDRVLGALHRFIPFTVVYIGTGLNFLLTLALSSASRLFLEAFRGDSLVWFGTLRAAQVVSLILLMGSLWVMRIWKESTP